MPFLHSAKQESSDRHTSGQIDRQTLPITNFFAVDKYCESGIMSSQIKFMSVIIMMTTLPISAIYTHLNSHSCSSNPIVHLKELHILTFTVGFYCSGCEMYTERCEMRCSHCAVCRDRCEMGCYQVRTRGNIYTLTSKMFGITWYFVSKESTERKSENCQSCQSICIQNKRRVVVALVSPVSAFNSPI